MVWTRFIFLMCETLVIRNSIPWRCWKPKQWKNTTWVFKITKFEAMASREKITLPSELCRRGSAAGGSLWLATVRCLRSCHDSSLLLGFCQFICHDLPGTSNWSNRSDLFVNSLSFFWRPSTFAKSCELILISSTFKTRPPTKRFVLEGDFSWKQWRPAPRGCHHHH